MEAPFDFETFFQMHYARAARAIARVIHDPACAEELAVEVFWKLWRHPRAHGENAPGCLYRAVARTALNELRRRTRSSRYESLADPLPGSPISVS